MRFHFRIKDRTFPHSRKLVSPRRLLIIMHTLAVF